MTIIGYARVSTTDQDLSIQQAALKAAGCEVIVNPLGSDPVAGLLTASMICSVGGGSEAEDDPDGDPDAEPVPVPVVWP